MAHAHESHGEHKGFREFPKGHPLPHRCKQTWTARALTSERTLALWPAATLRHSACEETHKIALLFVRQLERNDQRILVGILYASLIVEVHDFFQSFEAAVMRIRCASGDLSQGRGFKRADVLRILGHHIPPEIHFIVVPAEAEVVELFVGEVEPGVALRAPGFLPEQEEAVLRRG